MSRHIIVATGLFLGLTLASAVLLTVAATSGDAFGRAVLLQMGCAIFGAGLTVFVLRLLSVQAPRAQENDL